jgi:transposase
MSFINYDRSQKSLLGYSVDDFAQADKKGRFVVNVVSRLNLKTLYSRYSDQGGDSYAPDIMLALWFYAYSNGITSTRELEDLCKFDTRYMYISCSKQPDHTTLSRFRKKHLDLLSDYFIQIILIAQEEGLSEFNHIAIDGTKIQASSNARHSYNEDQLEQKIETIRRDIAKYMNRCDFAEEDVTDELDLETLRAEKERLAALEKKLLQRKKQLRERKKKLKVENRDNHKINLIEPDARFMPKAEGLNYNAQAAVDTKTNLIVAAEVTDEPNDQGQFVPLQQKVEETITPDPKRSYTGDAGYHNLDDLEYLEENNIDALVADPAPNNRSIQSKPTSADTILKEQRKIERTDFVYHAQENYYECPNGDKLLPVKNKGKSTVYRASKCRECSLSPYCISSKKNFKQLHRSRREKLAERMARKLQTKEAKIRMFERWVSVEPVFGNLKHNLGFKRFSLRGLQKVKGEFDLMAIAHNLNIIFKMLHGDRLTAIIHLSQARINQHIAFSKNILAKFFHNFARLFKTIIKTDQYCMQS